MQITSENLTKLGFKYDEDTKDWHLREHQWLRVQRYPDNTGFILVNGVQCTPLKYIDKVIEVYSALTDIRLSLYKNIESIDFFAPKYNTNILLRTMKSAHINSTNKIYPLEVRIPTDMYNDLIAEDKEYVDYVIDLIRCQTEIIWI